MPSRLARVKGLARAGWKSFMKPAIKKGIGMAKKKAVGAVKKYAGDFADTKIRAVGAAASLKTGNPLPSLAAEQAVKGKEMLMQKYFGAQSNKGSSHSGRNYGIKRKPAVRYPDSSARIPGARTVKPMPTSEAATLRNSNQSYSASHPTGAKI